MTFLPHTHPDTVHQGVFPGSCDHMFPLRTVKVIVSQKLYLCSTLYQLFYQSLSSYLSVSFYLHLFQFFVACLYIENMNHYKSAVWFQVFSTDAHDFVSQTLVPFITKHE